jgi:voltage-gated potassium channel
VERAVTPRGAAIVIATATIAITFAAGIVMTVLDRDHYPSLGSGLWWAVQTTTTVGYGDNVPTTAGGRLLAALIMLFGIGFLAVITAAITSTFVARRSDALGAEAPTTEQVREVERRLERIEAALAGASRRERAPSDADAPTAEQVRQIDSRLERIEAALTGRS